MKKIIFLLLAWSLLFGGMRFWESRPLMPIAPLPLLEPLTIEEKILYDMPLSLNQLDAKGWEVLPGIGPARARQIVAFRNERGGLRRVEDLIAIKGIGEKTVARLRPYFK